MNNHEDHIGPQEGPQTDLLSTGADIAIYGGAAGGGKSFGLLLDALRHRDNPKAGAVFFRRTSTQITNEGGLWDEATDLYLKFGGRTRERPNLDIYFPNPKDPGRDGFKVKFAHLQHEKNVHDYQGAQIPVMYFDELVHFTKKQFWYMVSRNRSTCGIRPYIRATCNPDKSSWVRQLIDWWIGSDGLPIPERSGKIRYLCHVEEVYHWFDSEEEARQTYPDVPCLSFTFIPSKLTDNKILMQKDPGYYAKLMALSKVDRERLLGGNWDVMPAAGSYFKREYFNEVEPYELPPLIQIVRCWDRAATEHSPGDSGDPDYTAGVKIGKCRNDHFYILDVIRERYSAGKVETLIKNTAKQDGISVSVKGFQDPGSAGKGEIEAFVKMLSGFHVVTERIAVDKEAAAKPLSAQAEHGNVSILTTCRNKENLYTELENFPEGSHDDIVDGASGAFNELNAGNVGQFTKEHVTPSISIGTPIIDREEW